MPVLALGVSHRRTPVELLERLAVGEDEDAKAYRRLADAPEVAEAVVLSTCNRVEVYAEVSSYHAGFLSLKRFLTESREVEPWEIEEPLYSHYEDHAAEHLFAVAAGLDSMVLGEPQILTQVRHAFRRAEAEAATGPVLAALFRSAVRTGRRVRAETAIGAAPEAMVEAGIRLAEARAGDLSGRAALVVGAGQMAALAANVLRAAGVGTLRIANRSAERASALAARAGGEAHPLSGLTDALAGADVVVACTGAAGLVVHERDVLRAMRRDPHPTFFLDLAVPRDVDPAVASIPGVSLVDVDDLRPALAGGGAAEAVLSKAEAIVGEEVARFASWRRAARLAPLIQALRDRGERAVRVELARALPRLASLGPEERLAVEALARGVVAKLLHDPIVRVKDLTAAGGGEAYARALAELFGLDYRPGA